MKTGKKTKTNKGRRKQGNRGNNKIERKIWKKKKNLEKKKARKANRNRGRSR